VPLCNRRLTPFDLLNVVEPAFMLDRGEVTQPRVFGVPDSLRCLKYTRNVYLPGHSCYTEYNAMIS
jgi:hypothetical protein